MEQPSKSLALAYNVAKHNRSKIKASGGEVAESLPQTKIKSGSIAKQIMESRKAPVEEIEEDFFGDSEEHTLDPMDFSKLDEPVEEESKIAQIMKRLANK